MRVNMCKERNYNVYEIFSFLRVILELARETDGAVVSNDKYRDLLEEKEWDNIIKNRLY